MSHASLIKKGDPESLNRNTVMESLMEEDEKARSTSLGLTKERNKRRTLFNMLQMVDRWSSRKMAIDRNLTIKEKIAVKDIVRRYCIKSLIWKLPLSYWYISLIPIVILGGLLDVAIPIAFGLVYVATMIVFTVLSFLDEDNMFRNFHNYCAKGLNPYISFLRGYKYLNEENEDMLKDVGDNESNRW
jgi:hypothetical protein